MYSSSYSIRDVFASFNVFFCLQAGVLSAFDEVLDEFLAAKPEERNDILVKGEKTAASLEGKAAG